MSQPPNPWPQGSWPPDPSNNKGDSGKPTLVNSMAIATELWLVVVLCQIIASIAEYSTVTDSFRDSVRETSGASASEVDLVTSSGFLVGVFVVATAIIAAVSLLIVWLARTGHNWARLVLSFFSAFLVVQAVLALFGDNGATWATIPTVIGGVAALGAAYLLLQRETETYCKAMATYRKSGGTPPPGPGWPPNGGPPPNQYFPRGQYPQQGPQQGSYPYPPHDDRRDDSGGNR
ncbi:phage holin family protein [Williamsia phyllosphaerae]|uniref:Uncharacterized protein n=1 Tax=Williamsia phyllosphaerae TaxID=885042 RepID=A0ABQ1UN54_9NOCA|nr:phage holin family protein [Williamsia phyllosphaerae]GGF22383.1 hypothetical protein GCM10007298_17890 [Williamsia phyllosphaerae]